MKFQAASFQPSRNFNYPGFHDGLMLRGFLWKMEQDARRLRKKLRDGDDVPGWVNLKIYTAHDRLQAAARYMDYQVALAEGQARNNPVIGRQVGTASVSGTSSAGSGITRLSPKLDIGYRVASPSVSQVAPPATVSPSVSEQPLVITDAPVTEVPEDQQQQPLPEVEEEKEGPNYLLIGGVVAGAFLAIYLYNR